MPEPELELELKLESWTEAARKVPSQTLGYGGDCQQMFDWHSSSQERGQAWEECCDSGPAPEVTALGSLEPSAGPCLNGQQLSLGVEARRSRTRNQKVRDSGTCHSDAFSPHEFGIPGKMPSGDRLHFARQSR